MNTVISTSLFGSEILGNLIHVFRDDSKYSKYFSFDQKSGLVQTNILNNKTIKWIWETLERDFPLVCILPKNSEYNDRLISFYDNLFEEDKAFIEIEEADVGFRISVFISQDRDDLQELFWQNLFPSDDADTKTAISCRTRDYIDDVQGIILARPEEERIAVRLGVWDEMQYRNGKLVVSSNLYSLIVEEERRRDRGKQKTGRMRKDYLDSR